MARCGSKGGCGMGSCGSDKKPTAKKAKKAAKKKPKKA